MSTRRVFLKQIATLPFIAPTFPLVRTSKAGFIPVMLTPFLSNGAIDWQSYERLFRFYEASGASGYFANCLSSEMYDLTSEERIKLTEKAVKWAGKKATVVSTGSFGENIPEKASFIKQLNDTGTNAVIVITSHLAKREESDSVLIENLNVLLEQTGNVPLGTYESPNPYKRVLTPEIYRILVDSKRFLYHKDTSENIQNIAQKLDIGRSSKLLLFNAHIASAVASLERGGAGLSPIAGNFYPEIIAWLCKHWDNKDKAEDVKWIQAEIADAERLLGMQYPMSAKYFLAKRNLDILPVTRIKRRALVSEEQRQLDQLLIRFEGWCDRLSIQPIRL